MPGGVRNEFDQKGGYKVQLKNGTLHYSSEAELRPAPDKKQVAKLQILGRLGTAQRPRRIHPTLITKWKRQAVEGPAEVFAPGGRHDKAGTHEAEIKELHAKIGQLTVEKNFLQKAFGR